MNPACQSAPVEPPVRRLKFTGSNEFQLELRRRVEAQLRSTGRRERDCPEMFLKTAIILLNFAAAYGLLVFAATTWWQALPLAILLALATAAIGFNIMHDASHQAYSNRPWLNKLMVTSLDLIGGSSYLWHWKHAVFHHTYVNISGYDTDIDLAGLGRLTPHHPRSGFHRWQHWYVWPLYAVMVMKWQLYDDLRVAISGRIGKHRFPRPEGRELMIFIGGKLVFLLLAFGLPLLFHSPWDVALCYAVTVFVVGIVLSVVFQLAHCVEEADFPVARMPGCIENAWAIHQVQTTVDFARRSRSLCWLLGGLNFQIEHHLFPRICHVNYPAIAALVEETCREFGVRYTSHRTFCAGLTSHFRWLRRMGAAVAEA